jgi:hypothetical protein
MAGNILELTSANFKDTVEAQTPSSWTSGPPGAARAR